MGSQEFYNFAKDFIYPAIIAALTSFLTYKAAYSVSEKSLKNENILKSRDLTDSLKIEINKLVFFLETLKEDLDRYGYFALQNTKIALNSIQKLKVLNDKVTLFDDEALRLEVIEKTETVSSLIEEIEIMENILVNEDGKLRGKIAEAEKEYRLIRVNLLTQGIYVDAQDNKPKYILQKIRKSSKRTIKQEPGLEAAEKIIRDLVSEIDSTQLDTLRANYEKKRSLLVVRILDVQTKLRELVKNLESARV